MTKKHPLDPEIPFTSLEEDVAWRIENESRYTSEELKKIQDECDGALNAIVAAPPLTDAAVIVGAPGVVAGVTDPEAVDAQNQTDLAQAQANAKPAEDGVS